MSLSASFVSAREHSVDGSCSAWFPLLALPLSGRSVWLLNRTCAFREYDQELKKKLGAAQQKNLHSDRPDQWRVYGVSQDMVRWPEAPTLYRREPAPEVGPEKPAFDIATEVEGNFEGKGTWYAAEVEDVQKDENGEWAYDLKFSEYEDMIGYNGCPGRLIPQDTPGWDDMRHGS